jgi:hypothetical protein
MEIDHVDTSERPEDFQDVSLIVKGFRSMQESLQALCTFETLCGPNQYVSVIRVLSFCFSSFGLEWSDHVRAELTHSQVLLREVRLQGGRSERTEILLSAAHHDLFSDPLRI